MSSKSTYPTDIFVSLSDLLNMELLSKGFSFLAKKQRVKTILGGTHASKLRGRGLDFEEVRNYVAGDDIRNIDWKVTARTKKTHTKVFSEEKERPVLIVVDQSKSMFFGSEKYTKSVVAAKLAALTAFRVLKDGDRVGGVVFADNGVDIILPKRNKKNILHFLEKIVERNHELKDSKPVVFEEALKETFIKIKNLVTHDYLIILISDFLRYHPDLIKSISQISQHNDLILAKIYDPMERNIPNEKIIAGDGEKQLVLDGKNKNIQQKFTNLFDENYQNFKSQMKKYRIPILLVDTVLEIDEQIKEILKGN
jgi:uncharacterized protein (DUF58 family)